MAGHRPLPGLGNLGAWIVRLVGGEFGVLGGLPELLTPMNRCFAIRGCGRGTMHMRHDVERYRMLLETETNQRVRKLLMDMIRELESRVVDGHTPVRAAREESGAATRGMLA